METSTLPVDLINRLSQDSVASQKAITSAPLPEAIATVRTTSERRLLHMTDKALSTVSTLMDSTDPKVRLAAASKALDISPATRPSVLQQQEAAIPVAAFTALLEGLGTLFHAPRGAPLRGAPHHDSPPPSNPGAPSALDDPIEATFTKEP